jgi:hypothetical protein
MRSKIAIPALLIASLFGATTIVSAQAEPAANEGTTHKTVKSSHMKPGTTTGMSTRSFTEKSKPGGQSTARKAPAN